MIYKELLNSYRLLVLLELGLVLSSSILELVLVLVLRNNMSIIFQRENLLK